MAAVVSVMSSMVTSRPRAFIRNQRSCGSAAVQRKAGPCVVVEASDGAVIDDLAVLVAPRRVDDLAGLELRRVAGDDAVDQGGRVAVR